MVEGVGVDLVWSRKVSAIHCCVAVHDDGRIRQPTNVPCSRRCSPDMREFRSAEKKGRTRGKVTSHGCVCVCVCVAVRGRGTSLKEKIIGSRVESHTTISSKFVTDIIRRAARFPINRERG